MLQFYETLSVQVTRLVYLHVTRKKARLRQSWNGYICSCQQCHTLPHTQISTNCQLLVFSSQFSDSSLSSIHQKTSCLQEDPKTWTNAYHLSWRLQSRRQFFSGCEASWIKLIVARPHAKRSSVYEVWRPDHLIC